MIKDLRKHSVATWVAPWV